ncbi:C2 domain-containing protein At1g53590-like isoform X2 [Euphorbia lathyris]|uniref:C2 domain-containing protein At1g53590-like isoform X2 n=1 Tax=Euphorbia lathyris TaxID=212925 RepID=UPI0033137FED
MDITQVSIIHHVGIVLFFLWLLSFFDRCHPVAYFISFIYLYSIHERYVMRLKRKLQFQERKQTNQKRSLSDSESVRWLNHAVEKIWPVCMEQIVSQKILLPIIPWFLDKYKPWTAKKAVVQHMYLGRTPPMFTDMRVLRQFTGDDHLVLELGMSLCTADDMSAVLAIKLRRRLGFGMWTKLHITSMHVEGKVLVGVKFLSHWPFLGRLRVCFAEPPYFQMNVKPIFNHGVDVTELPGIAGWLDKLLSVAFEETLVQPNMLVVDVEKFAASDPDWFSVDEKDPIAYVNIEVVEASDMKPSDLNGLADPYVKGQLGPYKFRTKIQRKTLAPKWLEQFKIPICTWESPNVLVIEVRDKDHFVDDTLGDCTVNINDFKDGERHVMWLPLQNIKMGRLHLAVTVEAPKKANVNSFEVKPMNKEGIQDIFVSDDGNRASFSSSSASPDKSPRATDNFEPINIEGQQATGIWVHHPGNEISQTWEPRKGKNTRHDSQARGALDSFGSTVSTPSASGPLSNCSSVDENADSRTPTNRVQRGFHKLSQVFHRGPKSEDNAGSNVESAQSPYANIRAVNQKEIGVNFIMGDSITEAAAVKNLKQVNLDPEGNVPESPGKGNVKDMAKSIFRHAEKSARSIKHVLSRKGSRRSQGDSSMVTEVEISEDTDSSDESLSSSRIQSIPVVSSPASTPCVNYDSGKTKENIGSSEVMKDIDTKMKKVTIEGTERINLKEVSSENGVKPLDEISRPKVCEEKIDGEMK